MFAQDDGVWALSHGGVLGDFDYWYDLGRITPPGSMRDHYELRASELIHTVTHELEAMYRTARQVDAVKLVIVDLDDTLWRGVFAEGDRGTQEGWPLGLTEALAFLKRRGIVLAICSKNCLVRHELPGDRFERRGPGAGDRLRDDAGGSRARGRRTDRPDRQERPCAGPVREGRLQRSRRDVGAPARLTPAGRS